MRSTRFYSTARTPTDTPNSWATVGLNYFVDIWDSNTTASIRVRAWDENWNGDTEIDICPGAAKQFEGSYSILDNRWNDEWGTWVIDTDGKGDGYDADQDARLVIQVKTVVREKAHTIVVNATDYGLDVVKEGEEYRFSGDDQIYLFYLNCSSTSANFVQGLNVIVLPRSLALESKINSTLYNLQGAGVDNPLRNASLRTPPASGDSSGHIVAMISKNLTGEEAETLLGMMTHNSTNARIGNSQIVPSTMALYLMHLPLDVVSGIPLLDVVNSPAGNQPRSFWNYLTDTLVGVVEFLWHGLVATAQFMCFLALAMTGIGLIIYILCDPSVQAAISQAINKIVDAFVEFVDWVKEFLIQLVEELLSFIANSLNAIIGPSITRLTCSMSLASNEINTTGKMSSSTKTSIFSALFGDMFTIFLISSAVIIGIILAIKGLTNIFGFLVAMAIGLIINVLFQSLFSNVYDQFGGSEFTNEGQYADLMSWLKQLVLGTGEDPSFSQQFWTLFGTIGTCFGLFFLGLYGLDIDCFSIAWVINGLALGLLGLSLGIIAYVRSSLFMAVVSLFISGFTLIDLVMHALARKISMEFVLLIGVSGGVGMVCSIFAIPRSL